MKKKAFWILSGIVLLVLPIRAKIKLLHEFAGGPNDGATPYGSLVISGTTLYGMTYGGGDKRMGTIFKIQTDGTGFTVLHEFAGGVNDGAKPHGSLILSGKTLYGMTEYGGDSKEGKGTIFKMQTDGTGFALLHDFTNMGDDGGFPIASLVLSGSTLYGMTPTYESEGGGIIFKIETDGSGFISLYSFSSGDRGCHPQGSLIISGTTLYGMGNNACDNEDPDGGNLFKMQTDGSYFIDLHSFSGGEADGEEPYGSLVRSDSTLYGMTSKGGHKYISFGTVFKIQTDGSGFSLLHKFTGGPDDGANPYGSLIISGTTLYGMAKGYYGNGTVFKIQTDGSDFTVLHRFTGYPSDGRYPYGDLVLSGLTLFGMTSRGGGSYNGVIFSLPLATISVTSPIGGESWKAGDRHEITWNSDGSISHVNIDYSVDNGKHWINVASGAINNGRYPWTVPNTPSAACLVRISAVNDVLISDTSSAVFAIELPLDLLSPDGGESWKTGDRHDIVWSSISSITKVKIDYSLDNGGRWIPVTAGAGNNGNRFITAAGNAGKGGRYSWTIPDTPSATCLVRISDASNKIIRDTSKAVFTIATKVDLQVERREARAFSILRQYAAIQFSVGNTSAVDHCLVMRQKGSGSAELIRTVNAAELRGGHFQMQDRYLEKGISYTYWVEAYDAAKRLIGLSEQKTI